MIRSMTGYGSATATWEDGTITVEARSVNSRGLKVVVKGPPGSEAWERDLRGLAESRVRRGRVDLFVRLDSGPGEAASSLDESRVRDVLEGFARLRDEFGVPGEPDLAALLAAGGLFRKDGGEAAEFVPDPEAVKGAAASALELLVEMRDAEGARLDVDLCERLDGIRRAIDTAAEAAPLRLERERVRLQAAVEELAGRGLDEERLLREIALIADRWDVGEEIVRARAHLAAFDELLQTPAGEPVGRRLAFLLQELQREVNTLGAKANDPHISRAVIEAKNDIDRLREQVENVE